VVKWNLPIQVVKVFEDGCRKCADLDYESGNKWGLESDDVILFGFKNIDRA
jgi:hypothetical protein